jgi:hypothetical protein
MARRRLQRVTFADFTVFVWKQRLTFMARILAFFSTTFTANLQIGAAPWAILHPRRSRLPFE